MADQPPKRVPENAPGDFYVEANCCLRCCVPHHYAPELMNDAEEDFNECYFRRQPRTDAEIEQAIQAICASEIVNLRYGGTDKTIISRLHKSGYGCCCDHA